MLILGPNLAVDTANRVEGLEVDYRGQVSGMEGDDNLIIDSLLAEFVKLSPPLTAFVAHGLFERFPDIAQQHSAKLPHVQLTCTLMKPKS